MRLRVAAHERHVVEPLGRAELAGAFEALLGDVDAQHAAGCGDAGGVTRRPPGPAADVEHMLAAADGSGGAQLGVVRAQLGLVQLGAAGTWHARNRMRFRSTSYGRVA